MLTVIDPSTGKILREFPLDTSEQVANKLAAAQQAFQHWRQRDFSTRGTLLRRVAERMRAERDRLGLLMTTEMGKPIKEARAEVDKAAWCAEHYAEHAAAYLADEPIASDASHSCVRYRPLGPVLGILPWNAPFWLAFRFCAPALMAGNSCLIKHDPHTPGCGLAIAETFQQAGAPDGLLQALLIDNPAVAEVIADRRIQAVSFTGSSRAGALVAAQAAAEIKPAVLELGGSDPAIVLAGADLDQAVAKIGLSRIINAGQSCIAAKRIIVEEPIAADFTERLRQYLATLQVGDPRLENTDVGPLARADLREHLHGQIQQTVSEGAQCLLGGQLPKEPGFFYPVTLLSEVSNTMTACREETFGPVAVVQPCRDANHAVELANDTDYGLAAAVWGETEPARAVADGLEAGQVVVNGIVKTDPRLPSGGIKKSGYGRELGPHGIREFVNVQQLWVG